MSDKKAAAQHAQSASEATTASQEIDVKIAAIGVGRGSRALARLSARPTLMLSRR